MLFRLILLFVILVFVPAYSFATEIRVAVASNFKETIATLAQRFEANSDYKVTLSFGSTGKHYAQIKNGAPFDVFLAADVRRPKLLEEEGVAVSGSRFTYAIGKIVLWSPNKDSIDADVKVLEYDEFRYLSIANPKLAPYGLAAKEILLARNLWDRLSKKIVRGENVAQAFQFIKSGNAELGFVAYSQIKSPKHKIDGSFWVVPQVLYTPIKQQAVIIKDSEAAREFISFVRSKEALKTIRDYGYDTP